MSVEELVEEFRCNSNEGSTRKERDDVYLFPRFLRRFPSPFCLAFASVSMGEHS